MSQQPEEDYIRDRDRGMRVDPLVEDLAEEGPENWKESLARPGLKEDITSFIVKHRGGKAIRFHPPLRGGYNWCFRLELEDGWATLRVPLPGLSAFLDEKTRAEAYALIYVAENTTIPVPRVYHWGYASQNPTGTGPFIIMDYFPETEPLSDEFVVPETKDTKYITNFDLPDDKLQEFYQPMANILLQLDKLKMPKIGSLAREADSWAVSSRPLPQNISDIITQGGCPESVLAPEETTYSASAEYYTSLADQHMAHFAFQHNHAVYCADDARDKYMARHLFRRLNNQGLIIEALRGTSSPKAPETFKFICDDLTPSNVLVDKEGKLVAVIDWEFAYFGPESMASAPPWWLLLRKPEDWREGGGLDDWVDKYPRLLNIFLKALEEEEAKIEAEKDSSLDIGLGSLHLEGEVPLSIRMRQSWESGAFWITWAARSSFGFDPAYWKFLDERFFGENKRGGYDHRMDLLSGDDKLTMDRVIRNKIDESKKMELWYWKPVDAQRYLKRTIGRPWT